MIISVGKELLLGDIDNTNEVYIARELRQMGVEVVKQITLNDELNSLKKNFMELSRKLIYL